MSWSKSNYDENPFPEQSSNKYIPPKIEATAVPPWLQDNHTNVLLENPTINDKDNTNNPVDPSSADIPRMILYTRVINLILSICMIVVSLLSILTTQSATTGVLACYLVVFSCLLCCFETHLKQVSKIIALNFGFMYSAKARSIFMLFLGTILFSFSLFGKIVGLCMLVNAGFNAYIVYKYPDYENIQRNDAQSDIKDFLAANPAYAQQFVSAGVDIIKNNPTLAKQGTEALFHAATSQKTNNTANAGSAKFSSDVSYTSV